MCVCKYMEHTHIHCMEENIFPVTLLIKENVHQFIGGNTLRTGSAHGNAVNSQHRRKKPTGSGELCYQEKQSTSGRKRGHALNLTSSGQACEAALHTQRQTVTPQDGLKWELSSQEQLRQVAQS